ILYLCGEAVAGRMPRASPVRCQKMGKFAVNRLNKMLVVALSCAVIYLGLPLKAVKPEESPPRAVAEVAGARIASADAARLRQADCPGPFCPPPRGGGNRPEASAP